MQNVTIYLRGYHFVMTTWSAVRYADIPLTFKTQFNKRTPNAFPTTGLSNIWPIQAPLACNYINGIPDSSLES